MMNPDTGFRGLTSGGLMAFMGDDVPRNQRIDSLHRHGLTPLAAFILSRWFYALTWNGQSKLWWKRNLSGLTPLGVAHSNLARRLRAARRGVSKLWWVRR